MQTIEVTKFADKDDRTHFYETVDGNRVGCSSNFIGSLWSHWLISKGAKRYYDKEEKAIIFIFDKPFVI